MRYEFFSIIKGTPIPTVPGTMNPSNTSLLTFYFVIFFLLPLLYSERLINTPLFSLFTLPTSLLRMQTETQMAVH